MNERGDYVWWLAVTVFVVAFGAVVGFLCLWAVLLLGAGPWLSGIVAVSAGILAAAKLLHHADQRGELL